MPSAALQAVALQVALLAREVGTHRRRSALPPAQAPPPRWRSHRAQAAARLDSTEAVLQPLRRRRRLRRLPTRLEHL